MFFEHSHGGKLIVLFVNVDNIIVIEDDLIKIQLSKEKLSTEFEIKYLGQLKYSWELR